MKIICVLSVVLLFSSCKKEATNLSVKPTNNFTITSEISGIKDSTIVILNQLHLNESIQIDSVISKDGFFKTTIPLDTIYQKYAIRIKKYPSKKYIYSFDVWSKDEDIRISGDYNGRFIQNLKIEGCELNSIEKQYLDVLLKYDKISAKEFEAAKTPEDKGAVFSKYIKLIHSDQIKFLGIGV